MSKFDNLKEHILELSVSDVFDTAKTEWKVSGIQYYEGSTNCPCSQEIKKVCFITNTLNGKETYVGSSCVNNFLNIDTSSLFTALKRLIKDHNYKIPKVLINYSLETGVIYTSEERFLLDLIKRKYPLTEKQNSWRDKIVWRILNNIVVKGE